MKRSLGLAALLGLASMTTALESRAADWYHGPTLRRYPGDAVPAARAFLADQGAQLRLAQLDLVPVNALPLRDLETVRFAQRYGGLPVIGKSIAVRIAADGTVRAAFADVARNLTVSTTPAVGASAAISTVESVLGRSAPGATADLAILPQEDLGGLLVWQVDVAVPRGLHQYVVDARTGAVLYSHPLSMHALGRVYDINWVKTPDPVDRELPELVAGSPQHLDGFEGRMAVYGYVSGDVSSNFVTQQSTTPNVGEDFLYDPVSDVTSLDDSFAEVNAFYHCGQMAEYFSTKHGIDMSTPAWGLSIVTSYGAASSPEDMDNAFFAPAQGGVTVPGGRKNIIAIGRGTAYDFAYDSDVFLHEFTHYVNHNAVNFSNGPYDADQYGLVMMPGGIDEGVADYFSCSFNDDAIVGEATLGAYQRDLAGPSGKCPDDMWGEAHADGELIGTATWAIRQDLGAELADQVVWGAVSLLSQGATFGDFSTGILQTAQDLTLGTAQVDSIKGILAERGLDDCNRALDLKPGEYRTTNMFGLNMIGEMMGGTCSQMKSYGVSLPSLFHFRHTPEADDTGLKLSVHQQPVDGPGALDWSVYARKGSMVTFVNPSGMIPEPSVYDYVLEHQTGNDGEMVIDASSDPPFDPTAQYYFVIVHQNCPMVTANVQSTSVKDLPVDAGADSPVEPDAGVDAAEPDAQPGADAEPDAGVPNGANPSAADGGDDDGGCGCRTPAGSTGSGTGALLVLGLALAAIRRRASR